MILQDFFGWFYGACGKRKIFGKRLNLSERYSEDLDYQTTQLSKFIEPAIIIILGLVVGVVLVVMYLPMFNMGGTIQ